MAGTNVLQLKDATLLPIVSVTKMLVKSQIGFKQIVVAENNSQTDV